LSMKKSILLAEHDDSVRKMVGRVLESAGYAVTPAGTRDEAAARFRTAAPDLVVWDLEITSSSGTEAIDFKAQLDRSVPVLGTTAWPNQAERAARCGISALLEKPLDLGNLLNTIEALLTEVEPLPVNGRPATSHARPADSLAR